MLAPRRTDAPDEGVEAARGAHRRRAASARACALLRYALAAFALGSGAVAAIVLWRHPGSVPGWLAALPAAVDLGWILCDRERQFLHDRLTRTRVVRIDGAG